MWCLCENNLHYSEGNQWATEKRRRRYNRKHTFMKRTKWINLPTKVMEFTKLTFWYVRARKDSCQYLAKLLWVDANRYHIWYCVLIWFLYCKVSLFGKPVVAHWLKSDSWHLTRGILCTEFGGHWINFSPNFEFRELNWPISCWLFTSCTRGGRLNEESFISSQNISLHFKNEKGRIPPNVYLPMIQQVMFAYSGLTTIQENGSPLLALNFDVPNSAPVMLSIYLVLHGRLL